MRISSIALFALMASVAFAIPSVGTNGTDSTYNASEWTVCRANQSSAWVSADNWGEYSPMNVCTGLGYADVDAVGGTCGTVCGFCGAPGYETYDGNGGDKNYLRYTVNWRCVDFQGVPQNAPVFPAAAMPVGIMAATLFGAYRLSRKK